VSRERARVQLKSDTGSDTGSDTPRALLPELETTIPRCDGEWILGHVLGVGRSELYGRLGESLTDAQLARVHELAARREAGEPLQYVLGQWGFRRLELLVDRRALIPRPETEILVERCLELVEGLNAPRVLDVGTGSGAIALAIAAEHPGARVTGIDVSEDALALARENIGHTGVAIELSRHDVAEGLPGSDWDLIVSNPPYVEAHELVALAADVVEWEPDIALVARGQTEALVRGAATGLRPGGALVVETSERGATPLQRLLAELGFEALRVTRDLAGRERVVDGRRPR